MTAVVMKTATETLSFRKRMTTIILLILFSASKVATGVVVEQECTTDGSCGEVICNNNDNGNNDLSSSCIDQYDECNHWARNEECMKNPNFMLRQCSRSCRSCDLTPEQLDDLIAERKKLLDEQEAERERLLRDFGVAQRESTEAARVAVQKMKDYMATVVMVEEKFEAVRHFCHNKHSDCVEWAEAGECSANPNYMTTNCAPACRTCHLMIFEERCPFDATNTTAVDLWKEGDVDKMFTRIVEKYGDQVTVLSQPPTGPWVVTMDQFLTDEQADQLIQLGQERGYAKSKDVGELQPDGTYGSFDSPDRTSSNTWCLDKCYQHDATQAVLQKLYDVTGVPDAFSEYLQLLHYDVGQFYGTHHDYIAHLRDRAEGVRIVTVFLYLNTVEEGGGTNFPLINNTTVEAKKGRALLWPSVLNSDPNEKDPRTDHQALPVLKGVKYAANAWLHNRDFKEVYARGCA